MLLTRMVSDDEGHLYGSIEDGDDVPLSVPHLHAVGKGYQTQALETELKREIENLKQRARTDTGNYYFIGHGNHHIGFFVIPYITFER